MPSVPPAHLRTASACYLLLAMAGWGAPFSCAADDYTARLEALAARQEAEGHPGAAEATRAWIVSRAAGRQYLFLPFASEPGNKSTAAPGWREWHEEFRTLRRGQAEALFARARAASDAGEATLAYQLLHEVLREDPDHSAARQVLGYQRNPRGQWTLPGEGPLAAQQARVEHPRLGWRPRTYWRLETPHFEIVTNHSAKEALELGRQLEELHGVWRQVFFRYWSSAEALAARFDGASEPLARPRPRMKVVLVKSRAEYVAQLAASVPQIERTVGIYLHPQRTAFFYAGDTSVYSTWHHEATHQLFQEAVADTVAEPGELQNFWAIEGAALYMESLARHEGSWTGSRYWTVGGCEADRLQFARYRALAGDFSLPLAELAAQSREQVQSSPEISKIYAQAAAVSHFLLDGAGGKHREAFVDLLTSVYRGQDTAQSLAQGTGAPFGQLDAEYRAYLNVTDEDLAGIPNPQRLVNLALGRTAVTDRGLSHLAACKNLVWIDLSETQVTDAGLAALAGSSNLRRLFLEASQVTDASLPLVGKFRQLEDLDLSRLRGISDEGLSGIAGLKSLRSLYLSATPIGDAGLVHLRGLKQLETLDITGTNITAQGKEQLRLALPKWKPAAD